MVKIQKPLRILFDVRGLLHEVEEAIYFSVSPRSDEGARKSMNPCDFCLHNELFEE
jgi:hypothetical protein